MKIIAMLLVAVLLTSCGSREKANDQSLLIRSRLQNSGCEFSASITADYYDSVYIFQMLCNVDAEGNLTFNVLQPESISGITGRVSSTGGKLTFDEYSLIFSVLSEGMLSPVSAPWVFVKALRSGYICGTGEYGNGFRIEIDDTYEENALKLIIYTDDKLAPSSVEMFWEGRRIIEMTVENFVYL